MNHVKRRKLINGHLGGGKEVVNNNDVSSLILPMRGGLKLDQAVRWFTQASSLVSLYSKILKTISIISYSVEKL
ncbi:MAG: hypothetical protein QXQ71_05305 [Desulfurococcaceae archaeon]